MTLPTLSDADLVGLAQKFPSLDFSDEQRRAVLLEMGTRDIQAAPGSGKTTLLAAKLSMLASKWNHPRRGICVLSHTNVARDEIAKRLGATSRGATLLGYPHFVGTIHAFVNQFLALPYLRSCNEPVDVVDDDVFAARAFALLKYKYKLKSWVEMNPNKGPDAIETLRYRGKDLEFGSERGELPGLGSPSHTQAKEIKDELRRKGVFRYCDMFAFAERVLALSPQTSDHISHRFPLVLIDEMQDTSAEQEELLSRIFNARVVVQRFGDFNQRILISSNKSQVLTFPKSGHLSVSSTKRFGESIAEVVRSVQVHGEGVTADEGRAGQRPVLFLYETSKATAVIDAFGQHVLAVFTDEELWGADVKAICARKQSGSKSAAGRHLGDYWPAFSGKTSTPSGAESAHRLLISPPQMGSSSFGLATRARDVCRAVLLAMRAGSAPSVRDLRDSTYLLRKLEEAGIETSRIRELCHALVVSADLTTPANWQDTLDMMYGCLSHTFDNVDRAEFGKARCFEVSIASHAPSAAPNEHVATRGGRSIRISLGTVASVKGETHLATLVLEAHAHPAKSHDLEAALERISNKKALPTRASDSLKSLYRNLYVATSRPTHLLCLAMNRERAGSSYVQALRDRGWTILTV